MSDYEDSSLPPVGSPTDPADHPATSVPPATEHHWGTIRMQGIADMASTMKKVGDSARAAVGKPPL